jgi:hypothetical protein
LLTNVCPPTLVLRMRNLTGAPETSALTLIAMGKIATGADLNPGTAAHCVELVETCVVCQTVSMQLSGVLPPPVPATTAPAIPATSASAVVATISFLMVTTPFRPAPLLSRAKGLIVVPDDPIHCRHESPGALDRLAGLVEREEEAPTTLRFVNPEGARPVLRGLSLLFWVATGLVVVASWQLFVLSGQTDRYFAWKIALPLTAAIDGAFYLAAVILLVSAARAGTWSEVRHVAWGVLTISTLKLAATLIHFRLFHFDHGQLTARIAAWGWLVVYAIVPIALVLLIWAELRTPGVDPPPEVPMPQLFRGLAGFLALAFVAFGLGLFFAP